MKIFQIYKLKTLMKIIFFVSIGIFLLQGSLTTKVTSESDLKVFQGIPSRIHETTKEFEKKEPVTTIDFHVGELHTQWTSENIKYQDVFAAVKSKKPIEIGAEMDKSKPDNFGHIYKLSVENKPVLTYDDTCLTLHETKKWGIISGCVCFLIAAVIAIYFRKNLKMFAE